MSSQAATRDLFPDRVAEDSPEDRIRSPVRTVGETPNHHFNVKVTAGRSAEVEVASVSRGGAVGKHSAALSVRTDRKPPGAPTGLHADSVTAFGLVLSWTRGASGSGPVRGYRVYTIPQLCNRRVTRKFR